MLRAFICCFCFIMAHSVVAQANSIQTELGISRITTDRWISTHAGQTQIDGINVVVMLETNRKSIVTPEYTVALPEFQEAAQKEYRLQVNAEENPTLRASYGLIPAQISEEGSFATALVSLNPEEFHFVVAPTKDGSMVVTYTRQIGGGKTESGTFPMVPLLIAQ